MEQKGTVGERPEGAVFSAGQIVNAHRKGFLFVI